MVAVLVGTRQAVIHFFSGLATKLLEPSQSPTEEDQSTIFRSTSHRPNVHRFRVCVWGGQAREQKDRDHRPGPQGPFAKRGKKRFSRTSIRRPYGSFRLIHSMLFSDSTSLPLNVFSGNSSISASPEFEQKGCDGPDGFAQPFLTSARYDAKEKRYVQRSDLTVHPQQPFDQRALDRPRRCARTDQSPSDSVVHEGSRGSCPATPNQLKLWWRSVERIGGQWIRGR